MRKLWYVGLESYQSRYSYQLTDWNKRVFEAKNINYEIVTPIAHSAFVNDGNINVGQVLDAVGRPFYALGQIQRLLVEAKAGNITKDDVIFFEDMFHPGIESLPYLFDQDRSNRPRIYVRCLAQTIDPDDFVHVVGMQDWMRKYEEMVLAFVDGVMVASHEMLTHMTIAMWKTKAYVTGLPFGFEEVRERAKYDPSLPWQSREKKVVFASRFDREKQPLFFVELARRYKKIDPSVKFVFLSGKGLDCNDPDIKEALEQAVKNGDVEAKLHLTKEEYYAELASARVLFNCALQDWVSNTVSEADALGCNVLFPAYRSFIEVFNSDPDRLYIPWSLSDAENKLTSLLAARHLRSGEIAAYQDRTIDRTLLVMTDPVLLPVNPADSTNYRKIYSELDWRS